jgi:wyosine [tRNA(Phe)-imidazoG37] synthetase (radical SAM superfamily)
MIAYGPVPSRRLGRSLGINNIPPKHCTYACAYCQLGRTIKMQADRHAFYEAETILRDARDKVEKARDAGERIDYLTFVPDGEPTLDVNLGREIELLQSLGIKIAVITNASLIGDKDVRAALLKADWVSLKVDSLSEQTWRQVDRPHGKLELNSIVDGALRFATSYRGELVTETMLVQGVNDGADQIREVAAFLARLKPAIAYLAVPTRPPAEEWVRPPQEEIINRAYQIVGDRVERAEYLIGYEGNAFAFTGQVEEDLLNITAVHPMREDAVRAYLARALTDWSTVGSLIARGQLIEMSYEGQRFYMRKLHRGAGRWAGEGPRAGHQRDRSGRLS